MLAAKRLVAACGKLALMRVTAGLKIVRNYRFENRCWISGAIPFSQLDAAAHGASVGERSTIPDNTRFNGASLKWTSRLRELISL
jgi:hypothetical protein